MNTSEQILEGAPSIQEFSKKYFFYISELLNRIDLVSIGLFAEKLEKARKNCNTLFFIGNGGSASTASHIVNDFGVDVCKKTKTDLPLRVLSLTDNNAMMLAIANDDGYENLFVNQLRIYYKQGDILVAISVSGNSPNVIAAAEWVKKRGGTVISLVGFDGGKLKEISDISIHVKSNNGEYGPVEDVHIIIGHLLSNWLQYEIGLQEKYKK